MKKRTKIIIIVTLAIILISGITVAASKMWWGDSSDTAQADTVTSDSRGESKEDATESDKTEIKAEYIDQDKSEIDTLKAINEASAKSVDSDKTSKGESNPKTADNMKTENGQSNKADNSTKESPAEKKTDSAFRSEGNTEAATQQKAEVTTETRTEAKTEKQTQATTQTKVEPTTQKKTEAPTQAPTEQKTEAPTQQRTEAPTEKKTEAPTQAPTEAPKCSHNWVWKTHTETVHHDAVTHEETYLIGDAWDEAVYVTKVKCVVCGTYYASDADYQANDTCGGNYGHENVIDHYIHHDAEYGTDIVIDQPAYDEYVEVKDYQYCSKCGERK